MCKETTWSSRAIRSNSLVLVGSGPIETANRGLCARSDDETYLNSSNADCVVIRHRGDRVTAVETINSAKEFMAARRLFERGAVNLSTLIEAGSIFDLLQSSRS